jgi:hypothetical protein
VNEPPVANAGPDQTVFRNDTVTVSGAWTDPNEASDNPYTWSWDLDGDGNPDDSGSANYGDTIVRTTSFAVAGVATLTFTVTDSAGATSSDTVDITVVNRAPVANNQSVSTDEDTPLPITLTGGDADGDTLTYSVLTPPTNGTLSAPSGPPAPNLTYTPNANYFGPDSFTFGVNDGLADSNIATVSITVNSVNDPVVAVDDTATTLKNVPVTLAVQVNDSAGPANEDQTLTTTAVTAPANGAAVINPDGSVTYTPNFNFFGIDSFAYTVCDSAGHGDGAGRVDQRPADCSRRQRDHQRRAALSPATNATTISIFLGLGVIIAASLFISADSIPRDSEASIQLLLSDWPEAGLGFV